MSKDLVQVFNSGWSNNVDRSPRKIIPDNYVEPVIPEYEAKQHTKIFAPIKNIKDNEGNIMKSGHESEIERRAREQASKQFKRDKFIYHTTTKNISFIQTYKDLKALGIKNNKFFLKLYNPDLMNVDPHSKTLTNMEKIAIITECTINPWYYLREVCRIPEQGGSSTPYLLNRGNLASTFCFLNHIDHYFVMPRQKGKTQSTIAIILWTFIFGTSTTEMMFVNKDQTQANENLDRLKSQRSLLPDYMIVTEMVDSNTGKIIKENNNVRSLYNPVVQNKIVTKPGAHSKDKAQGLGRGSSQTVQYFDEVEFTMFIDEILKAAGPAFNKASDNAAKNGAAYCRILTSTPGDLDSDMAQRALKIVDKCSKWTEHFYDWSIKKIRSYMAVYSDNDMVYIQYSYQQLGEDEAWFRKSCKSVQNDPIAIKREILLQRLRGSSRSPFDIEDLNVIESLKKSVKSEIYINDIFKFDLYADIDRSKSYIVSVDCATGVGGDSTAVTIIDPYDYHPIGEFSSKFIGGPDTSRLLTALVRTYMPLAIVCVERNSIGTTILDMLSESEIAHRIYYENPDDMNVSMKHDSQGFLVHEAAMRSKRGVWTGGGTRAIMIKILQGLVREDKEAFVTENITNQLMGLVMKKSGKIEHDDGGHDDSVMSYLIGLYVLYHGKNLSRFGFRRGLPKESERKGLIYEDSIEDMPEDVQEYFSQSVNMNRSQGSYTDTVYEENARIRKEMDLEYGMTSSGNVSDNIENIGESSFSSSFFEELNDW